MEKRQVFINVTWASSVARRLCLVLQILQRARDECLPSVIYRPRGTLWKQTHSQTPEPPVTLGDILKNIPSCNLHHLRFYTFPEALTEHLGALESELYRYKEGGGSGSVDT